MKDRHYEKGCLYSNFHDPLRQLTLDTRDLGKKIDPGHWQGHPTAGQPSLVTRELTNVQFSVRVDRPDHTYHRDHTFLDQMAKEIEPNRAWADEHFEERVGREPMNPDPSYVNWPWWQGQEISKQAGEQFTHTYSERFWPKHAGAQPLAHAHPGRTVKNPTGPLIGIRYVYGDLDDLCYLLRREKYTRQAYLPIFFPEDTGAVHWGRIPCTLGYHFLVRPDEERTDRLDMWYFLRSCDVVRHMRDDVYLAVRLMLWVIDECWAVGEVRPGTLNMTIPSLHIHMGDIHRVPN
jgi:hypothetical protein